MISKKDYVSSQVGNPDGEDKPNKKYVTFTQKSYLKAMLIVPLLLGTTILVSGCVRVRRP
jgi:fructose-bisphosphate aldolase class II